jgi:polar amino acid transport system permease protein
VTAPTERAGTTTQLGVVPRPRWGRQLAAVVVLAAAAAFVWSCARNENFQWGVVADYILEGDVLRGLGRTVWLTAASMAIGIVLGIVAALMKISANPVLRSVATAYIWFFRGSPVLVQLIFWFNAAALWPRLELFGLVSADTNAIITPYVAALLGLGLNEGAYMSEIIRAGILGVDRGQTQASRALGMTGYQVMRLVVLPQAMKIIVPPTANQAINMLKVTSLLSVVAIPDLLYSVQTIYSRTFETIPLLMVATLWYIAATAVLTVLQTRLERRFGRGSEVRT